MVGQKTTSRARKNLGDSGERVAALFLEKRGYRILEHSWRTRIGEIDLVAEDAEGLVFVEVRARRPGMGAPEESLTARKRARMSAMALEYLSQHVEWAERTWRIDFVAIELEQSGKVQRIEVIKNAVEY
jgi:putative endonuclease